MKKMITLSLLISSTISFSMFRCTLPKSVRKIFSITEINTRKNPFFQKKFQEHAADATQILMATYVFCHPEIMDFLKKAHLKKTKFKLILGHMDHGCLEIGTEYYKEELKKLNIPFKEFFNWNPRDQGCDCYFKTDQQETFLRSSSNISPFGLNDQTACELTNDPKLIAEFLEKFNESYGSDKK